MAWSSERSGVEAKNIAADASKRVEAVTQQLADNAKKLDGWIDVTQAPFNAKGDGVTDDTIAIQNAINSISIGTVFFPHNKTFIASGVVPKNNITLIGYGATIKQPTSNTKPIINYSSNNQLSNFNLIGLTFSASSDTDKTNSLVSISQPNPKAPAKTWYMSVVRDCRFNYGKNGIFCPIPGSVKIEACYFFRCDVGLYWNVEHFYISNSVFWECRRGIESISGNHFSCINGVFAHNEEYGVFWNGFEGHFIGCSFIDNKLAGLYGAFKNARIQGNRILQNAKGIYTSGQYNIITGNQISIGTAAQGITDQTTVIGIELGSSGNFNIVSNNQIDNFYRGIVINGVENTVTHNDIARITDLAILNNHNLNTISENKIHFARIGIGTLATVYDMICRGNSITNCQEEGIFLNGTSTGLALDGNYLVDNSTSLENGFSGIKLMALLSSTINNNVIRNSGAGKMKYGIETGYNGSSGSVLVANNVTRNMKSVHGFALATNLTKGTNVGTVIDVTP